ncbi:DNA-binding protein [Thermococcus sp. MV5]|uniref:PPC domain-containing DNA-binding protein n=1 Tax=Thermococcus sp. MV5 TaxID=1638272 RepID=UPI0014398C89|nr:PPC domain-containing DNA-binding protein [Thermococcus sp. MV5]NJE26590.1 DNA-binding protein [Thermococcus sp. MV5]
MYIKRDNEYVIVKLERNEDLLDGLTKVAKSENIKAGMIISGIGMLKDLEMGYYTGTEYERKKFEGIYEIVSITGYLQETAPRVHVHVSIADKNNKVYGGHLLSGKCNPYAIIAIISYNKLSFKRVYVEKAKRMETEIYDV